MVGAFGPTQTFAGLLGGACIVALASAGCGGSIAADRAAPPDESSSAPAPVGPNDPMVAGEASSPGTATGAAGLRVVAHVLVKTGQAAKNDAPVVFDVLVWMNGHPADVARVDVGTPGKIVRGVQTAPGHFFAEDSGYRPFYAVSVEADGARLDGVRLRSPSNATLDVAPIAQRGHVNEVGWHPARDPNVDDVHLRVLSFDQARTTFESSGLTDLGHFSVPSEAFPVSGSFVVALQRMSSVTLASGPDSVGVVEISADADVIAR